MSKYNNMNAKRAVALKYDGDQIAPIIVASGVGHMAEKILEVADQNNVPVYEDTSLATMLSRLELGQEIPEELYKAVVDIYVFFLNFSPERQMQIQKKKEEEMEKQKNAEIGRAHV